MNKITGAFILFLLLVFCRPYNSGQAEEQPLSVPLSYLDKKIISWIDSGYYKGAAIKIIKDNEPFFEEYYEGFSDTTILHVASAGKWIAAATVASVVEQGSLSWNDPVHKYLPEFTDIKGTATLRQLLSHTAGYPDYQPKGKQRDKYQTLEESVYHIINLPPDTLPGTKFLYGGLSMQVAGRMVEKATGKDWETVFQENIAIPLKMNYSSFTPVSQEGGFNPMLGGGFRTCLKDYMNFLEMFINEGVYKNKRILSADAIAYIQADHIANCTFQGEEYVKKSRQNLHTEVYGLGLWREETDVHGQTTLISSPGWAGAYPWIDKTNNVYGFFLAKVNVEKANKEGFSSFYGSAVFPLLVREAIKKETYSSTVTSGLLELKNTRLYYEESGEGEPLIFIHGHSLDHRMWENQFWECAKRYRTIRYDLRGYGYSQLPEEGEQFTHVEDLIELMDLLGISKAHIVGLSLGGYIGTDLLGWYPDRVLSATLVSGNIRHLPKPSEPITPEEAETRNKEIIALKRKGIEAMKQEWFAGLINSGGTKVDEIRQPLWEMISQWSAWQPLHHEARVTAGDDAFIHLKENKPPIPVLIVEGNAPGNPCNITPELLNYLPEGRFILLEDCGHMLNMEQPEAFNQLIINFINDK